MLDLNTTGQGRVAMLAAHRPKGAAMGIIGLLVVLILLVILLRLIA